VVAEELKRPALADWLVVQSCKVKVLASVCTGAFLLEQAGLLNEREVITHWEDIDELRDVSRTSGSLVQVLTGQRWVEAKPWVHHGGICRLFTSAGISAGMDLSLHLVAELASPELARRTARQMDFDWRAANGAVVPAGR
jgi:transcriptional regulator GlxA family with amidase domain